MSGFPKQVGIFARLSAFFFDGLAAILPTPTVERAVSALTKAASALAAAEARDINNARDLEQRAAELELQAAGARESAERAARIRDRLTGITA